MPRGDTNGFVKVRGARQNNLRGIDVDIPRNAFVVFTGVSGSGKSSLAFGTIYAEAQRRYFESIAPYARQFINQLPTPHVAEIEGLPPAVAIQQRRAEPTARSTVGTLTKLSNSLRMLFSRAGTYPKGAPRLDSDAFSANTVAGACPDCHGLGVIHTVTEDSLVPDPSLSIREKAIAAWPGAWQGKNYRDILGVLGYDLDKPWRELSKKDRQWILFTEEKPVVTVHAEREAHRIQRPYQGTYMSAASYVLHTFANTNSATLRKRVARFMETSLCKTCNGKRLKKESLAVKIEGYDIGELAQMSLAELVEVLKSGLKPAGTKVAATNVGAKEGLGAKEEVASMISSDLIDRIALMTELGLDYLSLDRTTPTLSAGELQRLRLTSQLKSGLFGVVYVLDEPSAGLHPADSQALVKMLGRLQGAGNSLFVVEHDLDIVRQADWIVDLGPAAGDGGGELLYSGTLANMEKSRASVTARFLFAREKEDTHTSRKPTNWMKLTGIYRHNLQNVGVEFPLQSLTVVTGVSGSGKSTLVSQVLAERIAAQLGTKPSEDDDEEQDADEDEDFEIKDDRVAILKGAESIRRLVSVDQKPIGRTPRSNLATYTGLFDHIRKRFAATKQAKARGHNASRFSFNVDGGRCTTCEGEGFVSIELLFLPSVYAPCTACDGTRYNEETLAITDSGLNIAQVLDLTVDAAAEFYKDAPQIARALDTLRDVGLGYLHLGQPATELSGGEAQRIKLATELQRAQVGNTLYLLDEPTTGLHPADTRKLMKLLHALVEAGNTVIVVEHDMDVIAHADWVIDLGPGAGADGGKVVASGAPNVIAKSRNSQTAKYLAKRLISWLAICGASLGSALFSQSCLAQQTVLPTDITPTQANLARRRPPNHFQLRLLEKLPASFFLNASAETTFRIETNPYQYPLKRTLLHKELPPGTIFSDFTKADQKDILEELNSVAKFDNVYRVNPSVTAGWSPSGATQYFVTYFALRDSLMRHTSLNSTTQAIGVGAQHTWFVGNKVSVQPQITIRELYQTDEPNVLDYLPAITAQYMFNNNLVAYVNVLYQMRMRHFVGGPGREMNPFYTEGLQYNRGRWTFLASGTFLQNFRQPFGKNALIQQNNYSYVCDFEIDRQISEKLPGVQAIIRAEPVYNFHGKATPGIAGMDFRLYYGVRITAVKPAFTDTMKMLRQRYQHAGYTQQQSSMSIPAAEIAAAEGPS